MPNLWGRKVVMKKTSKIVMKMTSQLLPRTSFNHTLLEKTPFNLGWLFVSVIVRTEMFNEITS